MSEISRKQPERNPQRLHWFLFVRMPTSRDAAKLDRVSKWQDGDYDQLYGHLSDDLLDRELDHVRSEKSWYRQPEFWLATTHMAILPVVTFASVELYKSQDQTSAALACLAVIAALWIVTRASVAKIVSSHLRYRTLGNREVGLKLARGLITVELVSLTDDDSDLFAGLGVGYKLTLNLFYSVFWASFLILGVTAISLIVK